MYSRGLLTGIVYVVSIAAFAEVNEGYFRLQTQFLIPENKCLSHSLEQASGVQAGAAFMADCRDDDIGQYWRIRPLGSSNFQMSSKLSALKGLCLDGNTFNSPKQHKGATYMEECNLSSRQRWNILVKPSNNWLTLKAESSNSRCLEGSKTGVNWFQGGASFLDKCQSVTGQNWTLVAIDKNQNIARFKSVVDQLGQVIMGKNPLSQNWVSNLKNQLSDIRNDSLILEKRYTNRSEICRKSSSRLIEKISVSDQEIKDLEAEITSIEGEIADKEQQVESTRERLNTIGHRLEEVERKHNKALARAVYVQKHPYDLIEAAKFMFDDIPTMAQAVKGYQRDRARAEELESKFTYELSQLEKNLQMSRFKKSKLEDLIAQRDSMIEEEQIARLTALYLSNTSELWLDIQDTLSLDLNPLVDEILESYKSSFVNNRLSEGQELTRNQLAVSALKEMRTHYEIAYVDSKWDEMCKSQSL